MTLPHFNIPNHSIFPMQINFGTYCNFIDGEDTNYDEVSINVMKLTTEYLEVGINAINDELVVIEQIFKMLNNKPTMVVNYESPSNQQSIIGEVWFKGFNITNIEGLFTFDCGALDNQVPDNNEYIDIFRRVKLYYEYESIEYMKTDPLTIRKNKLNKLMDKEGNRHIIDRKMIK